MKVVIKTVIEVRRGREKLKKKQSGAIKSHMKTTSVCIGDVTAHST